MQSESRTSIIYIVGAQSTGKTTLVNELAKGIVTDASRPATVPWVVAEVARTVLEQHSFRSDELTASPERALALQKLMLAAQVEAEDRVLEVAGDGSWIVCDRSGIDPIVYARLYAGREAAREMEDSSIWDQLKTRMARSVIILCEPVAAFLLDDGVRLMPDDMDEWMRVHREFCDTLQDYGLSYHVVGDGIRDLTQRRHFAVFKWLESSKYHARSVK